MAWTDTLQPNITAVKKIHIDEIRTAIDGHILLGGAVHPNATTSVAGFMSAADKTALNSLVSTAGAGVASVAVTSPITSGGTAGNPIIGIQAATSGQAGYMSAADKAKLDGISAGATSTSEYSHPATHSADIIVDGSTNKAYTATEKAKLAGLISAPIGSVLMWYGDRGSKFDGNGNAVGGQGMEGWRIFSEMDGKFPLGAGSTAQGSTGGEQNHTLTIDEMPAHDHSYNSYGGLTGIAGANPIWANVVPAVSGSTGGNLPHNNMPPYYSIWFIIRIS